MRRILIAAAATTATCALGLTACGIVGGSKSPATTTTQPTVPATTTTTVPHASIEVRPPSGPVGTSFQLLATRFQPAETVIFEIDFPSGKVFKGQAHKAAADGSVTAMYRVTTGNPLGTYQVKAAGDQGTQATGQFEVAAGTATTSSTPHSATTLHTATTGHTTTTKKP